MRDWEPPSSIKGVQQFLGFANFYRKFIRGFSTVAEPITALTKKGRERFVWSSRADKAFRKLKTHFSSAPILVLPDPALLFIVEVDASEVGVGAILSQQAPDGRIHPCAFLSHRLGPAESRSDVRDRELLAVKMALEEWRHWLEGAQHLFLVWTDHRNLEYLAHHGTPWGTRDAGVPSETLLVAWHGQVCYVLRWGLSRLHTEQEPPPATSGVAASAPNPTPPMVSRFNGLCDRSSGVRR